MKRRASLTISPHSGAGGCAPRPRKDSVANSITAKATRIDISTMIGAFNGYILTQFRIKRDIGAIRTRLYLDQLDSTAFPRGGYKLVAQVFSQPYSLTRSVRAGGCSAWTPHARRRDPRGGVRPGGGITVTGPVLGLEKE